MEFTVYFKWNREVDYRPYCATFSRLSTAVDFFSNEMICSGDGARVSKRLSLQMSGIVDVISGINSQRGFGVYRRLNPL